MKAIKPGPPDRRDIKPKAKGKNKAKESVKSMNMSSLAGAIGMIFGAVAIAMILYKKCIDMETGDFGKPRAHPNLFGLKTKKAPSAPRNVNIKKKPGRKSKNTNK